MALASLPTGGKILPMQIRQSAIPAVTERIVQGAVNMFNEWEKTKAAHKQEFMEKASSYDISKKMTGDLTAKARAANAQDMQKLTEIYSRRSDFFGRVSSNDEELNSYINAMTERQAYIADIDKTLKEENEKLKLAETKQGKYNEGLIRQNIKRLEGFLSNTDLETTQQDISGVNKGFWRAANNQEPEGTTKGFSYSLPKGAMGKTIDSEYLDWKTKDRHGLEAGETNMASLASSVKNLVSYNKASKTEFEKIVAGNRMFNVMKNTIPTDGSVGAAIIKDEKGLTYLKRTGLSKLLSINPNQLIDGVTLELKYKDYNDVEQTIAVSKDSKIGDVFPDSHEMVKNITVGDLLKKTDGDISKGVDILAKGYLMTYEQKQELRSIPSDGGGGKKNYYQGVLTNVNYTTRSGQIYSDEVEVLPKPMPNTSGATIAIDTDGMEYKLGANEGKVIAIAMGGKALEVAVGSRLSDQYNTDKTGNLVLYDNDGAEISSDEILVNKEGQNISYETAQENIANGINDITDFSYDGNPIGVKSNEGKLINDKFVLSKDEKHVYIPIDNIPQYKKERVNSATLSEIQERIREKTGVKSLKGKAITDDDIEKMPFNTNRGTLPKWEKEVYDLKIKQAEKKLEENRDLITISNAIGDSFVKDGIENQTFIIGSNGKKYMFNDFKKVESKKNVFDSNKTIRYTLPTGVQSGRYYKVEDDTGRVMYIDYDYWIKTEFKGNKGAFLKDYFNK